ncbi:hypothetical protein WICANDRAFT_76867 [Wickerhamomyces anomalus NRRL Y-366-8]|uniref:Uncharacterized protein n=1 Tax=Wickerhamomyces anomalus (strain ATCC 58044 / CBS 1984 / NCYC 433 / NRRL Y-366-8) TaxID=683960 RepID=A0A1E3PBB5_WICAA|nr:uncharacterized protein WICANDRAFT_76867 [Wickerhamomyces anomalus NRRL Y-366-8]ODQ62699.1 hypothetical protein WICANDRAFT_76867 [Wickerhamomyces anomalus NRRL Y-366-8]
MRIIKLPAAAININIIVIIIGTILLTCQGSNKKPYRNIYTLKLDFTNINFTAVIPFPRFATAVASLDLQKAGLSDIYSIGVKHYCKGQKLTNGDYRITYCTSASKNYYFEPHQLIASEISNANRRNALRDLEYLSVRLPSSVDFFRLQSKMTDKIFITMLVGVLFAGISLILNFISLCYPPSQEFILGISFLSTIVSAATLLISAAIATSVYDRARKGFSNGDNQYGISGTWGNSAFYALLWLIVGLQLIYVLLTIWTAWSEKWLIKEKVTRIRRTSDQEAPIETNAERRRQGFRSRFDRDSDAEEEDVPRYPVYAQELPTYQEATRDQESPQAKEEGDTGLQRGRVGS